MRRATEAWGRRSARSSISNWTSGRTAKWPGWKRWDWFWRDFTFESLKDLKINMYQMVIGQPRSGWKPECKAEIRAMGSSKLQKSWQFYAPGFMCSLYLCWWCWRSHSASDSSRAVDTCQIRSWGVYPPWEAELHLGIYGGVYIYIFTFTQTIELSHVMTRGTHELLMMQGYLMKKGRENNQFLPRKFVLSEIDNTIKYYVKVDKRGNPL